MRPIKLLIVIVLFASCKKQEDRSCFKRSGEMAVQTYAFGDFNRLFLKEHIRYRLIQDSTNCIVVRGGKNLLNFILVDGEGGLISIQNKNRCNYLRKYEVPTVEIHYTRLINILFEGTEELITEDTMLVDYLTLTLRDGAGIMNMKVKAQDINVVNTHGWGSVILNGETNTLRCNAMGDGRFDCRNLKVNQSIQWITSSSVDHYLNAPGIPLQVELNGIGNIFYHGTPSLIQKSRYGSGDLIPL